MLLAGESLGRRNAIRYTIEYLAGADTNVVVCSAVLSDSSLAAAVLSARAGATLARTQHRANRFQIRDQLQGAQVVANERFWGFTG
ncbi:MAG: hypothetical protein ABL889_19745 [Terricaulis sp.]